MPEHCNRCDELVADGANFCMRCGENVTPIGGGVVTKRVSASKIERQGGLLNVVRRATMGEYEILGELGRGGMATVYLAHDIALNRKVALKVMAPELFFGDEDIVERFHREARTAASLSHPHIIPIYAVRESDHILYFVMKCVQGRSLESVLHEEKQLPIGVVQTILTQVGQALDYAHRNGVIHRDIKPGNIMLDEEGWAVVTDFGIAKAVESEGLTSTGMTIGTPAYMSPEQCKAGEITGAADQYSLGIVAYEMLTGKVPFEGSSAVGIMYQHTHEPSIHINEHRPDCPEKVADAIMRMISKRPEDRWPTFEAAEAVIGASLTTDTGESRTQMVTMIRAGGNQELLAQFQTPRSPIPKRSFRREAGEASSSAPTVATPPPEPTGAQKKRIPLIAWAAPVVVAVGVGVLWQMNRSADDPQPISPAAAPLPAAEPVVASLAIVPGSFSLPLGETFQLTTSATDSLGRQMNDADVSWRSENPDIVEVSAAGLARGTGAGVARITATAMGTTAAIAVTVPARPVTSDTPPTPPAQPAVAASITVLPGSGAITVGDRISLSATALDARGGTLARSFSWRSSDPDVAAVDAGGTVTGLVPGTVQVTASADGRSETVTIRIAPMPVASVALSPSRRTLTVGETVQLAANPRGANGDALTGRPVTWRSGGAAAAVAPNGVVTGAQPGTATIEATIGSARATAEITVVAPTAPEGPAIPEPDPAADRQAVTDALNRYARAIEAKDLNAIRLAYPGITTVQGQGWSKFFSDVSQVSFTINVSELTIRGDVAQVSAGAQQVYRLGGTHEDTVMFEATLERTPNGWRIVSIFD